MNVFPPFKPWAPLPLQWLPDTGQVTENSGSLQWYKYGCVSLELAILLFSHWKHEWSQGRFISTLFPAPCPIWGGPQTFAFFFVERPLIILGMVLSWLRWCIGKPLHYSFKLFQHVRKSCSLSAISYLTSNQTGVIVSSFWKTENVNGILDHVLSRKCWWFLRPSIKRDETARTVNCLQDFFCCWPWHFKT